MSQPNNTGEGKEKHSDRWHAAEEIVTSEYTYMNQLKYGSLSRVLGALPVC